MLSKKITAISLSLALLGAGVVAEAPVFVNSDTAISASAAAQTQSVKKYKMTLSKKYTLPKKTSKATTRLFYVKVTKPGTFTITGKNLSRIYVSTSGGSRKTLKGNGTGTYTASKAGTYYIKAVYGKKTGSIVTKFKAKPTYKAVQYGKKYVIQPGKSLTLSLSQSKDGYIKIITKNSAKIAYKGARISGSRSGLSYLENEFDKGSYTFTITAKKGTKPCTVVFGKGKITEEEKGTVPEELKAQIDDYINRYIENAKLQQKYKDNPDDPEVKGKKETIDVEAEKLEKEGDELSEKVSDTNIASEEYMFKSLWTAVLSLIGF